MTFFGFIFLRRRDFMTIADVAAKLAALKTSIDTLAAAIAARPAPIATQAEVDALGTSVDDAAAALAAIPPQ
jgi:hypothetical protein